MRRWSLPAALLVAGMALAGGGDVHGLEAAIDGPDVIERRSVRDGQVTELYAGRIEGHPPWVWEATWLPCDHPQPEELAELRYLAVDAVAPLLASKKAPGLNDLSALPVVRCESLSSTDRFYSLAIMKTPPLLPTFWSLVDNTRVDRGADTDHRRMTIRATQVVGSMGGLATVTDVVQTPTSTLWQSVVQIRLGMPVPDAILDAVIPKAKAPPRRTLLERLRQRARTATTTP